MTGRPVVAVTGASGYVGGVILDALGADAGVIGLVRHPTPSFPAVPWRFDDSVEAMTAALCGIKADVIVHAAWDMTAATLVEMRGGSVGAVRRLLAAARAARVSRFVFISTISAFDGAVSAYGRAKREAERLVQAEGGVVIRLGLVHGPRSGGVFGAVRDTVRRSRFVPLIGDGSAPQYLLSEAALGKVVRLAVQGAFDEDPGPITLADPAPIPFRALVAQIAQAEGRRVTLLAMPWPVLFAGLWLTERLGLRLGLRSDSVISFVRQDPHPNFAALQRLGLIDIVTMPDGETRI